MIPSRIRVRIKPGVRPLSLEASVTEISLEVKSRMRAIALSFDAYCCTIVTSIIAKNQGIEKGQNRTLELNHFWFLALGTPMR